MLKRWWAHTYKKRRNMQRSGAISKAIKSAIIEAGRAIFYNQKDGLYPRRSPKSGTIYRDKYRPDYKNNSKYRGELSRGLIITSGLFYLVLGHNPHYSTQLCFKMLKKQYK